MPPAVKTDPSQARQEAKAAEAGAPRVRVIFLSNLTTGVELRDGRRVFGDKVDKSRRRDEEAVFVELRDEGIKLDVPSRVCSKGHRLEFELELFARARHVRFRAKGVVDETEIFPHLHDNIALTFTHFDTAIWGIVLSIFRAEQDRTTELFNRLRGTEKDPR